MVRRNGQSVLALRYVARRACNGTNQGPSVEFPDLCRAPVPLGLSAAVPLTHDAGRGSPWPATLETRRDCSLYVRMDPLSILHPKTVAEARAAGWRDLAVQCRHCPRLVHIPWDRFSQDAVIERLGDRMRCLGCSNQGAVVWADMNEREF